MWRFSPHPDKNVKDFTNIYKTVKVVQRIQRRQKMTEICQKCQICQEILQETSRIWGNIWEMSRMCQKYIKRIVRNMAIVSGIYYRCQALSNNIEVWNNYVNKYLEMSKNVRESRK